MFQLPIGIFGLVGNTLATCILSRMKMKNPFNRLLVALAVYDNFFIIFMLLDYSFVRGKASDHFLYRKLTLHISAYGWPFNISSEVYAYLFPKLLFPLNNIFLCCSMYLIVCIAFERYTSGFLVCLTLNPKRVFFYSP